MDHHDLPVSSTYSALPNGSPASPSLPNTKGRSSKLSHNSPSRARRACRTFTRYHLLQLRIGYGRADSGVNVHDTIFCNSESGMRTRLGCERSRKPAFLNFLEHKDASAFSLTHCHPPNYTCISLAKSGRIHQPELMPDFLPQTPRLFTVATPPCSSLALCMEIALTWMWD